MDTHVYKSARGPCLSPLGLRFVVKQSPAESSAISPPQQDGHALRRLENAHAADTRVSPPLCSAACEEKRSNTQTIEKRGQPRPFPSRQSPACKLRSAGMSGRRGREASARGEGWAEAERAACSEGLLNPWSIPVVGKRVTNILKETLEIGAAEHSCFLFPGLPRVTG